MRTVRILAPLALVVVAAGLVGCGGKSDSATRLQGAGSSFVDPMMQEWKSAYTKETKQEVNYQSKGSGAGISAMTAKEVDFGCSDAPLNEEQLKKCQAEGGDVIHVPLCMGAIVPAYNVPGVTDLVFDGELLVDIFQGKVKRWNDPRIIALNEDKKDKLPNLPILVVTRSDSSGSTYILTDYFHKVSPKKWTRKPDTNIPKGVGTISAKGNDGVAGELRKEGNAGAIGYVELIYALKNNITYGLVKNSKDKPIKADMKSVTAAAATADIPDDLRYSITNAPGEDAYPISGTVWAICYVKQPAKKAEPLRNFLKWVTHDGQKLTDKLHYAPLPEKVVKKIDEKLALIKADK